MRRLASAARPKALADSEYRAAASAERGEDARQFIPPVVRNGEAVAATTPAPPPPPPPPKTPAAVGGSSGEDDGCVCWISSAGCLTPLHYDLGEGLLAQHLGTKRIWLYPWAVRGRWGYGR